MSSTQAARDSAAVPPSPTIPAPAIVPYADALRVAGALAVIVIHVTGDGASAIGTLSMGSWWLCLVLEAVSRWAVPIFVMISGMLLLDPAKVETPGQFYQKRLRRLAIPFIAWSVFYLLWRHFYEGEHITPWEAVSQLISGGAYYHLWFVVMLIGLYLSTPLLRLIVRGLTTRQLWLTTLTILLLGLGDAVVRANQGTDFTFFFKFTPFIGLYFLGYCLRLTRRSKKMIWMGAAAAVSGAALSSISTYFLVFHCATSQWNVDDRLFLMEDEFSPGNLLMTVGVFTLFAAYYESRSIPKPSKWIQSLSAASLGIYLSHPLFLSILNAHDIDYEWHGVLIGIPSNIAIAAVGSGALSLILLKIPILRQTI